MDFFSVGLTAIIYVLLLKISGIRLSEYKNQNRIGVLLRLYLLTIGLVIDPPINGILIFIYTFFYFSKERKISKRDKILIILCLAGCFYVVFNTLILFSVERYDPEFNPYIGMLEYIIYFAYYILLCVEKYNDEERNLLISQASLFAIAIFIVTAFNSLIFYDGSISRMNGIFRNPNLLGIYSAIIFSLVFFNRALKLQNWLRRLALISAGAMLFLSFSRVAWLGIIVFLILFYTSKKTASTKTKILSVGVLTLIGLSLMLYEPIADMVTERVFSAFNLKDYSTSDRIVLIQAAWDSFMESPICGNGIRSFASIVKSGLYPINSAAVVQPHNAYFELLQSLGILGFLLFFLIIYKSVSFKKKNNRYFYIVIMFLTIGLLSRLFNEFPTTIWFWLIVSLC